MTVFAWALPFDFAQPKWLWLALLAPLLVVASIRSLAGLDAARRALSLVVRSTLVVLIACCLADVQCVKRSRDLTVIFLLDRSHSVESLQDQEEQFVHKVAERIPPNDRLGLIDFAREAYLEQQPMIGGYFIPPGRLPPMPDAERTNVAAALRLAMAMFPHDTAKRMVLLSDGNDNMGDVLTEARRAKADRIPIDIVPQTYQRTNEVFFERMIAPTYAEKGEQVPIRMVANTTQATTATITLTHNGKVVPLSDEQKRISLKPGSNTLSMKLPVTTDGTQTYEATLHVDDPSRDVMARNNTASAFTFVAGGSRALLLSANAAHDRPLADALRSENVEVDLKEFGELGDFRLPQMMSYSSIILANIPAATFTQEQQQDLVSYVRDMGSGLILTGGDESFGAGGWIGSPVEEVTPVTFEIKNKRMLPKGALVLVVHSCEIARGNFWAKEMAKKAVDTISSQDYIGVLDYSYSPMGENWEVPLQPATNKAAVKARIDRMQNGDMMDFGRIMEMAYKELTVGRGKDAAQKHVILFSDGDPQPPSDKLLDAYAAAKITVSTIGIGWGQHVMEPTLKKVAYRTEGRYYAAKNPNELPQIFVKESKVVRRPLIIDEPFRPSVQDAYSELLSGVDASDVIPPLGGLVLTSVKQNPNVILPLTRRTDDGDDPVLAHWQYGLGKSVVFASGYWPAWGDAWTRWSKFAKFWAQLVRWSFRQEAPANFDTYTKIEGNKGTVVIDALDKDAGYLNNLQLRARLMGPDSRVIPLQFTQRGPGVYQADFDAERSGAYLASVQAGDGQRSLGTIRTGATAPFSPEYRDLKANETVLRQIAEITGGRWIDRPAENTDIFSHDLPPTEAKKPVWDWVLAWLALPVFLLDVAVRRLASWVALSFAAEALLLTVLLFGFDMAHFGFWSVVLALVIAEVVGWTIRHQAIGPFFAYLTHGVTALAQSGERSEASLRKLKGTRDRVREGQTAAGDVSSIAGEPERDTIPVVVRKRRFDVGDVRAKQSTGDLADALGGAKRETESDAPRKPASSGENEAGPESMTERLLRTKRKGKE